MSTDLKQSSWYEGVARAGMYMKGVHLTSSWPAVLCAVLLIACSVPPAAVLLSQFQFAVTLPSLGLLMLAALPRRRALLGASVAAAVLLLMIHINERKIAAVGLPITSFDVQVFLENPSVLPNALGLNPARLYGSALFCTVLVTGVAVAALVRFRHLGNRPSLQRLARRALLCLISIIAGALSLNAYGRNLARHLEAGGTADWQDFWLPESQVKLSRQIGPIEYLAFTQAAGRTTQYKAADIAFTPAHADILRALEQLQLAGSFSGKMGPAPNIVLFHAESTFDPNTAFHLKNRIDLPIWSRIPETILLGTVRTNVLGGGSWVSEFEVLTGVDSRVFGYQGFYTHYYLAPLTRNSLVMHLRPRGYRTAAFYPAEASFYNARQAFLKYGFEEFIDAEDLDLPSEWSSVRDSVMVRKVLERRIFDGEGPFLYFVSSTENHGPHACTDAPLVVEFSRAATAEETCRLNEYVRRAGSTSAAFVALMRRLQDNEQRTGRPWLLVTYGDHQPWSFTEGAYSVAGGIAAEAGHGTFSRLRTAAEAYEAILHIAGSESFARHPGFDRPVPAWFLPTLASAMVSSSAGELYIPVNAYLVARCGPDLLSSDCASPDIAAAIRRTLTQGPTEAVVQK